MTSSMSLFTAPLQASRHVFTPTSEAAFRKGGTLRLGFRKTGRHIAALTLEQMCRLFYLKRAIVMGESTLSYERMLA